VPRRVTRNILIGAATFIVLLVLVRPILLPLPLDRCKDRKFDSVAWRDSTRAFSRDAVRGCMVDQLLRRIGVVGLQRDSVFGMLGPGDRTNYFKEYDAVYWLGPERGLMSIDSEWLVLRIGWDGRVLDAKVVTD
jgi:hypothetical protein